MGWLAAIVTFGPGVVLAASVVAVAIVECRARRGRTRR